MSLTTPRFWIAVLLALAILQLAGRAEGQSAYLAPWPWRAIADCETGGDDTKGRAPWHAAWHTNGLHDGGLQFHPDTWNRAKARVRSARRYAFAYQAPPWVQVAVARSWLKRTSWKQWPACSRIVGLR